MTVLTERSLYGLTILCRPDAPIRDLFDSSNHSLGVMRGGLGQASSPLIDDIQTG